MAEYKAIDKANLQVALSANNKKVLEHMDNADSILRENLNIFSKYQRYINTELAYIHAAIQADTTINSLTKDTIIPINRLINSNGNIEFNSTTYTFTLKAGKTYKVTANIRLLNSAGYLYYRIYNITQAKYEGTHGCIETPSIYNINICYKSAEAIIVCDVDTEIQIRVNNIDSSRDVTFALISSIIIQEINRQITIDPVNYVNESQGIDDTPIGNIISYMGNSTPTHYLICDGAEYNILDYPQLANHILNEFGSYNYFGGDGELTFCVPDLKNDFPDNILYCIKYESTYYMTVTKTATQEEVDLLKEEIELLKQEISQLSEILDEINGTEV